MAAMPGINATAVLVAAAPGVVTTSTVLSLRLPRGGLSVLNRKLVICGLLSQQQGTNQRTGAD